MTLIELLKKDISSFLSAQSATAPLLKRILLFLEDGEFTQADAYCEKVLDIEPENALAYLGKLMAARRISSLQELATTQYTVDSDGSFKKAIRFAPAEMKQHLHALNMEIYANCIAASRNRARIHMAHGELKETAQQYHNAMKLWEDSKENLPNAEAIYNDLANEVADFNWKLLLHHRQCPDDQQLITRSIPIDTDRWYLSAVKWADAEKKAYFESVAKDTLFNAHLKCMEAVKSQNTKLANIWAGHYEAAASSEDPLPHIHRALVETEGFTRFASEAPAAMLKLIGHYKAVYPHGVDEIKGILQDYYVRIFQSLLDFTGTESNVQSTQPRMNEERYELYIAQKEAQASNPDAAPASVSAEAEAQESSFTDPVWATETTQQITQQMAEAASSELSPFGLVSTYLVAAKELTVRYGKKDGIVTVPLLFRFICKYYNDAIALAEPEQASAIQTKLNDFLIDTVRLPSASTEIVADASAYMQGSTLPYQIYLSRITNNYSVKQEELIPPQITEDVAKWQRYLDAAKPKRDCYWLSDQQDNINAVFTAAENAIANCRQYTELLKKSLDTPYQAVITSAGEGQEELSSGWSQKMEALQRHCDEWANDLQTELEKVQQVNATKLELALKHIKLKEALQLTLSIAGDLLLVLAVLALALPLIPSLGIGWQATQGTLSISGNGMLFYGICMGAPVLAGVLSLLNGWAAGAYAKGRWQKALWLFLLLGAVIYGALAGLEKVLITEGSFFPRTALSQPDFIYMGAFALLGILRSLLEYIFSKLTENTRSRAAQITCKVGTVTAGIVGLAQALVCFCIAGLFVYAMIIR